MSHDETRQLDALFRTLERDHEQYVKAARAVHEDRMKPFELTLLWDQLASAHRAWMDALESKAT